MTTSIPLRPDKFRYIIEEGRTGTILTRDLKVMNPQVMRRLSGPCAIEFDIHDKEPSVQGIVFKPWGHWCHVEAEMPSGTRKIIASGLYKPSEVDPEKGMLHAAFEGFSGYVTKIPWLQNWNPIAVDPFEIFDHAWKHVQSYSNGNLGVVPYSLDEDGVSKVIPPVSNTQLLPGVSLQVAQGADFILEFFAIFIRAIDFTDVGDYLNKLARDIPFDYFEESEWNEDRTAINKYIQLAYPRGGVLQSNLAFRMGENFLRGKTRIESEIEYASDVIIRGWFPGKVYSSTISNDMPTQYRRTILEEDVNINSVERSAAWAHRQLTRRQFPNFWESININIHHPNAPFGTWDVGDNIRVQGQMPWVGEVDQIHKIIAYTIDEASQTCELTLKAEGAFNYDPIFFEAVDVNEVVNPDFTVNLSGWTQTAGAWSRDAVAGAESPGAAKVTATGVAKELTSSAYINVEEDDRISASAMVAWIDAESSPGSAPIWYAITCYTSGNTVVSNPVFATIPNPQGDSNGFQSLAGVYRVPAGVAKIKARLMVRPEMIGGDVLFDDIYLGKHQQ